MTIIENGGESQSEAISTSTQTQTDNPLASITSKHLGPAEEIDPAYLARVGDEAALDKQIVALVRHGVPYITIADVIGMPIDRLLRRISSLMSTRSDIMSTEMVNDYLIHQLRMLDSVTESAMKDIEVVAGEGISESVAGKIRHNGRLAMIKALQQQAVITGLIRQRIDIRQIDKVAITVLEKDDWEAL